MMRKIKSFTLIEIVLYIALSSVIIFTTTYLVAEISYLKEKTKVVSQVENQGFELMRIITLSIRNAGAINTPTPTQTSTSLSLNTQAPISTEVFNLVNGVATEIIGSQSPLSLTGSDVVVENLSFKNLSLDTTKPSVVKINFSLKYNSSGLKSEFNYKQDFESTANIRIQP